MAFFGKVRNTINLLKNIDLDQLAKINKQIDLSEAMQTLGQLDENQLKGLMKMLKTKRRKGQADLPPIDGDFYNLDLKLSEEQRDLQLKVRNFMEDEVRPLVNDHWNRAKFPFEIIEKFKLSSILPGYLMKAMAVLICPF
jgi:glutaryl-CoA dehydrogenase